MSPQALRTLRLIVTDTCDGCAAPCDVEVAAVVEPGAVPHSVSVTVRHREWGEPHRWRLLVDAVEEELRRLELRRDESGCREGQDPSDGRRSVRWVVFLPADGSSSYPVA